MAITFTEITSSKQGFKFTVNQNTFEMVKPIDSKTAEVIYNAVINYCTENDTDSIDGINTTLFYCPICFKPITNAIRIIIPDPLKRFPWDEGCFSSYKSQID